ncbi:hypothetical protein GCM10009853_046350 [Glycomyces scopariae]
MWSVLTIPSHRGPRVPRNAELETVSCRPGGPAGGGGVLVVTWSNLAWIICHEMLLPECPVVDVTLAYYNSKPQVKGLLARLRRLVTAIDARDWHEPVPQLSQLATGCRNGQPRAIRDRLAPDEYQRLLGAVRAGVSKRQLAKQYGMSLRSVYRLPLG